jgi:hypothetical protein
LVARWACRCRGVRRLFQYSPPHIGLDVYIPFSFIRRYCHSHIRPSHTLVRWLFCYSGSD